MLHPVSRARGAIGSIGLGAVLRKGQWEAGRPAASGLSAGEDDQDDADNRGSGDKGDQRDRGAAGRDGDQREAHERQIGCKNACDNAVNRKATIRRALIKVRTMGLPERFAGNNATRQGECRVGQIVERQQ